jgi:hypothetical protein
MKNGKTENRKMEMEKWEMNVSGVFAWLYVHLAYKYELADPCCHIREYFDQTICIT